MKALPFIVLLAVATVFAESPRPVTPPAVTPPVVRLISSRAWLGLQISKPDPTLTAQLPTLPPGIGFVVRTIDANGPAAEAGLREFDILWKLGDQMLVNEAQLATLLALKRPGEEVTLEGFRAGQPQAFTLKLGTAPVASPPFPDELVDSVVLPGGCGGPMRVVNPSEKLASFSGDEGSAQVRRENGNYHVTIKDAADKLIYQGTITPDSGYSEIPQDWQRRVRALCRGLDHVLDGRITPRQPRPRVVPPPTANQGG